MSDSTPEAQATDLVSDQELVRRFLASFTFTNHTMCRTRQWYAQRYFGVGSTAAAEACMRHGFNPDERVVAR